jgi:threonine dehydrogenase-like Zn-dependent dehydrogenase
MWKILFDDLNGFRQVTFEPGKIEKDYVRIKPEFIGVCGSDKNIVFGGRGKVKEAISLGHEISGFVLDGEGSDMQGKSVRKGDKVVVFPNYFCGECPDCKAGHVNTCRNKISIGVNSNGGLSEVFDLPSKFLLKIDNSLELRYAALIEPVAVMRRALAKFEDRSKQLIIIGGGSTGTIAYILADILNFTEPIILESSPEKVSLLKSKGFRVINIGDIEQTKEIHASPPLNVLDTVGRSATVDVWLKMAKSHVSGSQVIITGLDEYEYSVSQSVIIRKELSLNGSIIYDKADFISSAEIMTKNFSRFDVLMDYEGSIKDLDKWLIPAMKRNDILKILIKL